MDPTPLLVEQRFPLSLSTRIEAIRELYDTAKQARWDPRRDIPWEMLEAGRYQASVREAARLVWSRRAWVGHTALTETPSLLVRLCMETGREADPKFFLSVRNTEEAWHIECCEMAARAMAPDGTLVRRPGSRAYEALFNRALHRRALDATRSTDAFVAVHAAYEDGLELALLRAQRAATTNPAVAAVLDRMASDKERHATFGWLYLQSRAPGWDAAERATIEAELAMHVNDVELAGYHMPWLSPNVAGAEAAAELVCAEAGLGACAPEAEAEAFRGYTRDARARLASLGVALPGFRHAAIGAF